MFRTIFVPLDGTSFSEQALPVAMAIARRTGARVRLAQVHRPVSADEHRSGVPTDITVREDERAALARVVGELTVTGIPAESALLHGPVAETLGRHAREVAADLVVMTTHGRGPLSRAALGSVADSLVRSLHLPTLLIRPGESAERAARHGQPAPARHLLIALDGSPGAEAMLPAAVELGEAMGAAFTLLRVVDAVTVGTLDPSGVLLPYIDEAATEQLRTAAAVYLERVAAPLRAKGLCVMTRVVVHPDPTTAILEEAHALGCDLIALESHGRSGLARLLFGSVSGGVARHGHAPVLTHTATT